MTASNESRIDAVNEAFKAGVKSTKEPGTHLFQAVDYHQVLDEDKLELDYKFCNRIEDEFHELNDYVVLESIIG